MSKQQSIKDILKSRIMVLDGAMATMIQKHNLEEKEFKGKDFKEYEKPLKGMYDLLNLTQPQLVSSIHRYYLESGADIITTNTFSSNKYSLLEYGLQEHVYKINLRGAQIARTAADRFSTQNKPRYVAGSIGPGNKSIGKLDPDSDEYEEAFKEFEDNYYQQAKALIDGGVDIIMLETFFDMINAKAAISAISKIRKDYNYDFAVMVSATIIKNKSKNNFDEIKEFFSTLKQCDILSIGLNCSYGSKEIRVFIEDLAIKYKFNISTHPNAGLPNEQGEFLETPEIMAYNIKDLAENNLVNIIGSCCGSTPAHTRLISEVVEGVLPRTLKIIKN